MSRTTSTTPTRILVVANETVASDILHVAIRAQVHDEGDTQVLVVAPALNSRLRFWLSDDDTARSAAERRLEASLARLVEAGVDAEGVVGDADPVQAIADALRTFPAEGIVIATHPEGRSNWLARDLVVRALERFRLPVAHVVVDAEARRETLATSHRAGASVARAA